MDSEKQKIDIDALATSKGIKPDDYYKILLTEYDEIGRSWRHYDQIKVRVYNILIPTSLAAFYVSLTNLDLRIPIGGAAVLLCWLAFLVFGRLDYGNTLRWNRASEIEDILGMDHHKRVKERKGHEKGISILRDFPRVRVLTFVFTIIVTLFWLILLSEPNIFK